MSFPDQLSIPKIKWGKRKKRSQMCEIFTEDGRIETVELDVLLGCVDDPNLEWGFVLDAENQYVNTEDGYWTQIFGERSCLPICMINPDKFKNHEELVNQIYHEAQERAKESQYAKAMKNVAWEKISTILTVGFASAVLIFGIVWFTG